MQAPKHTQTNGRGQGRSSAGGRGNQNQNDLGKPSRIENAQSAFSLNDLNTIFSTYGKVLKIATFERGQSKQAFVMYEDTNTAQAAIGYLQNFVMFSPNSCRLRLSFSRHEDIEVKKGNTDRQWDALLGPPSSNECLPGNKPQQNSFQGNQFQGNQFQNQQIPQQQPRQGGFQTDINDLGSEFPEYGDHVFVTGKEVISRHMAIAKHVEDILAAAQSKQNPGIVPNQFQGAPLQNIAPIGGAPFNQMGAQQQAQAQQGMQPQQQFNNPNQQPYNNQNFNQIPQNNPMQNNPQNRQYAQMSQLQYHQVEGINPMQNPQFGGQQPFNQMQMQQPQGFGQQQYSQA